MQDYYNSLTFEVFRARDMWECFQFTNRLIKPQFTGCKNESNCYMNLLWNRGLSLGCDEGILTWKDILMNPPSEV